MSNHPSFQFKIITPERLVYHSEVTSVTLPTTSGEITVYAKHIPLVTVLKTGKLTVHKPEGDYDFAVHKGIIEVRDSGELIVLAGTAEVSTEIDVERAQVAYERAQMAMKQQVNESDVDFARFKGIMERELNRIKIGKR